MFAKRLFGLWHAESRCRSRCSVYLFLSAGLAIGVPATAAVSYVQGSSQSGPGVRNSSTANFANAQAAGDLNVVFIAWQGAAASLISVADSVGNVYTRIASTSYGATATQAVYYARNIVGSPAGKNSVTATFNTKVANPDLRVLEYSGLDSTRPFDVVGGQGSFGALTSSGLVSVTNVNDLLLASNFSQQSVTGPGVGFTLRLKDQYAQVVEDAIVTAVGNYAATAPQTRAGWFVMQVVAFRAAVSAPPVLVPSVAGQIQADAINTLLSVGLVNGINTRQSSVTVAAGYIIGESPAAGTSVPAGSSVSLIVSNGPPSVVVPNVVGSTQSAASSALAAAGLIVGSITQQGSATIPAGSVMSESPNAGTGVSAGASVSLVISNGPAAVSVPNVTGMTQAAASGLITSAGLVVGVVTQQSSATVAAGNVVSESPAPLTSVFTGSQVNLVISSGLPPVVIPNVVGMTQDFASGAITGLGLVLGTVTQQSSSTVAAGKVISESPISGTSVPSGSPVSLLVSSGVTSSGASPYPASSIFGGISWDESSKQRYASGSDIWDSTWASDGAIYGVWGDGNGFSSPAKAQIGIGRLSGYPGTPPLAGADVYLGSPSPRVVCGRKPTIGGKPHGVVALPNAVMYMFHSTYDLCRPAAWLARSLDNGVTWTDHVGGGSWPDANGFGPVAILQYGAAQFGALVPDNTFTPYIYIYGGKSATPGSQYLARVPAFPSNAIESSSGWSYYAGVDASGNPLWAASSAQAVPVWTDPNYAESIAVSFNPAVGRYIAYNDHGNACGGSPCERQVSLFDGPSPWGPWTTFDYEEQFDNVNCGANCLGDQGAVGWAMMQKWFSPDGLSLWIEYSAPGAYDALNLIRGTISLASGSTVTNLVISTGAPAVVDRLSLSDPGNLEFIDSSARFSALPSGNIGAEVIRLPRNDAAIHDANYVSFTSTVSQNVCVAWNSANPLPLWLSSWTVTGENLTGDAAFNVYSQAYPAGNVTLPGPGSGDAYVLIVGCH